MAYSVPALEQLLKEIDALAPDRSRLSDGWIGDQAHASRHSDHNPEPDGSVDARDFTHDPAHGADMNVLSEQVKDDPRIEGGGYVIWNERIWNPSISRSWRAYTGTNPHTKHMHVSVSDRLQNDTSPWLDDQGGLMPDDVAEIVRLLKAIDKKLPGLDQQERDRNRVKAIGRLVRATQEGRPVDDQILGAIEAD